MKKGLAVVIIILFIGMSITTSSSTKILNKSNCPLFNGKTLYVGGSGPGNYTKIQDAIDDSVDGDTVFVYDDSSPYNEEVKIEKSINLIGEDKNSTIIESFKSVTIIKITGDGVSLSDFTIRGGLPLLKRHCGISLIGYGGNTIENNCIENVECGILIQMSNYNNIHNNEITKGTFGIYLGCSSYNNIYQNNITNNINDGILIFLTPGCEYCDNNNIYLNNIMKNNDGISIIGTITHGRPRNNKIYQNNIMYNRRGVYIDSISYDNKIYHNNFINNLLNARDKNCSGNYWDEGSEGNYWDTYRGKDKDGDGIGDTPYWLPPYIIGNKDRFPLMEPYEDVPDVSIKSVNKVIHNRG